MKIYFVMNSINDAHANKRVTDFKREGHDVKQFGFLRHDQVKYDNGAEVIGRFTNDMSYKSRIGIYVKGLKDLFRREKNKDVIWYYQGIDVALFATQLNPNKNYIYEECDLAHTYVGNKWVRSLLEKIDQCIIRKSMKTVVTSEGFIQYHYKSIDKWPKNIVLVPNKLSSDVLHLTKLKASAFNPSHIRFAFVGALRYPALLSIADIISREFPCHEFHFYGYIFPTISEEMLPKRNNVFYHGAYKSPDDLPQIYADIDVIISTYDTKRINVMYAEPNKLYESIYFERPIVVSTGTFLADKVRRLGIGYDVDSYKTSDVIRLVHQIEVDYEEKVDFINKIDKQTVIDSSSYVRAILS